MASCTHETGRRGAANVLILPFPSQGHVNPMLQFTNRLISKGLNATFVNTIFFSNTSFPHHFSSSSSSINFQTISDGFDQGGFSSAPSDDIYVKTFSSIGSKTLFELIKKLESSAYNNPVKAIVYDGFLPWVLDVGKSLGIPCAAFFTQSCSVNSVYYHAWRGLLQVPTQGGTVSLPCLPPLRLPELPSFVHGRGSYSGWADMVLSQFSKVGEAHWVLVNVFYDLEREVVDWMSKLWNVKTIGPTVPSMYLDKRVEWDWDYGLNMFEPKRRECMEWLRGKAKSSVVYVSFGSIATLGEEEMGEVAWGLKESGCNYLWVVREKEEDKLPKNFKEEENDKGLIVSWCPQLEVLSDEAVGCFLTHCGFNSMLESLSLGVPMVAMPRWTDQGTNAKFLEDVWRVGVRVCCDEKEFVRRERIEESIREVMGGGEKGVELRKKAVEWSKLARVSVDQGGSSDANIDEFVAQVMSM